jgi:hypothetical protein
MKKGNAYVDIPVWDYLYRGLQMGINVWDVINILDRLYYRLDYEGTQATMVIQRRCSQWG